MNCAVCRGACCESFSIDVSFYPTQQGHRDANRWLALHAITPLPSNFNSLPRLEFECRCTQLTSEGRCAIWEDRPMVCELFIASSKACLDTVRKRRTPEQYQLIRGEDDPPTIHEFPFAGEVSMTESKVTMKEGIRLINELIQKFDDCGDPQIRCDLLEEMESRAEDAHRTAEEEMENEDDVDDAEEDLEDDELADDKED